MLVINKRRVIDMYVNGKRVDEGIWERIVVYGAVNLLITSEGQTFYTEDDRIFSPKPSEEDTYNAP